jgi:DNA-directed RNA polymerase specialized sigma24 family protein
MKKAEIQAAANKVRDTVIQLRDCENLTFAEIGLRMGFSASRARQIYYRAIRLNRKNKSN